MTIQLTRATFIDGVLEAAASQHTLDAATEAYFISIGAATRVGDEPNVSNLRPAFTDAAGTALVVEGVEHSLGIPYNYAKSGTPLVSSFAAASFNNATLGTSSIMVKKSAASRKIQPTTSSSVATVNLDTPLTPGTSMVGGIWVYLESPDPNAAPAGTPYINIQLINTGSAAYGNAKEFPYAGYHLKWNQWNYLTFHTGETGKWNADGSGTKGWTNYGTGSFAAEMSKFFIVFGNMAGCTIYLDSVEYGQASRPSVLFGFDACSTNLTANVLPIMIAAGIKGFVTYNATGAAPTSIDTLRPWMANGWEVVNHGYTHTNIGTMTDDASIIAEVENNWNAMLANKLVRPGQVKGFIGPGNGSSPRARRVLDQLGYKFCRNYKNLITSVTPYGVDNLLDMGSFGLGNPPNVTRLTDIANAPYNYGGTTWLFTHEVNMTSPATGPTGNVLTVYVDDLQSVVNNLVAQRDAGKIDLPTPSQWYKGVMKL